MGLRLVTTSGSIQLGEAPASQLRCFACNRPAQIVADNAERTAAACAQCTTEALCAAAADHHDPSTDEAEEA